MLHLRREYMQDGLITKDKYGDWCVPPESLELIHSKDPARITDGTLISTAYYIKLLDVMQRFASLQNLKEDQAQWAAWAKEMKEAFNRKYLHIRRGTSQKPGHPLYPDSVYYGNNTVTSNVLPLAFNIVPNDCKEDVAKQIVSTTILKNGGHISCGVIGVQWLLQELSRNGFADVAFLLASKKTYPSWGYMAEQGATTTWELWNGNTADPKMNSGNHVMLLGGLLPWCYEHAAGIRSDSTQTGFRHIILKPDFDIQNLFWAKASYRCPYGTIKSAWKKTLTHLEWDITIPCNTTAEVHLPDGRVEQIGSGDYHYSADIPALHPAVLENQFLYEKASFPECHASTIVELENGDLVAAFFRRNQRAQSGRMHLGMPKAERKRHVDGAGESSRRSIRPERPGCQDSRHHRRYQRPPESLLEPCTVPSARRRPVALLQDRSERARLDGLAGTLERRRKDMEPARSTSPRFLGYD